MSDLDIKRLRELLAAATRKVTAPHDLRNPAWIARGRNRDELEDSLYDWLPALLDAAAKIERYEKALRECRSLVSWLQDIPLADPEPPARRLDFAVGKARKLWPLLKGVLRPEASPVPTAEEERG